ncbi:O-antigen ligase family protein [Paraclostridium bifermentans]
MIYLLIPYFISISIYNPEIGGFNLSTYLLMIPIILLMLNYNMKIKLSNMKDKKIIILTCMYIYMWIHLFFTNNGEIKAIIEYTKMVFAPIIFIIFLNVIKNEKDLYKLIKMLTLSTFILCIYGSLQSIFGVSDYYLANKAGILISRSLGTFKQPNVLASYIVLVIPFSIHMIFISKKTKKIFYVIVLFTQILCLYLTYSRWALISLIIVFIFVIYRTIYNIIKSLNKKNIIFLYLFLLIIIGIIIVTILNADLILNKLNRGSNSIRFNSIIDAVEIFKGNIFGVGVGNNRINFILDSSYLRFLVEAGIFGFILIILLYFNMYIDMKNKLKNEVNNFKNIYYSVFVSFNIFLVNAILENIIYNIFFNFFIGLYIFISYKSIPRAD